MLSKKELYYGYTTLKEKDTSIMVDDFNIPLAHLLQKIRKDGNWRPQSTYSLCHDIPFMPSPMRFTTFDSSKDEEK